MQSRPARPADLPAITDLQRRWEMAWFGAAEHDEDEVREEFDRIESIAEHSRVLLEEDRPIAAAWWFGEDASLLVDPDVDARPIYADVLPWFAEAGKNVEALSRDEVLRDALLERGWTHHHSSFELIRPVSDDWVIAEPVWPAGIELTDLRADDAAAIHQLIYVDAAWAEVPGHPDREFAQWRGIFVTDKETPDQQVLAWRDGRLVGVSMGRIFSDGAGWIAQLAVAKSERGQGLGRALLLESLRRRVAAGATMVGLSVEGENRAAIGLYLDVGLTIDREWQKFTRPTTR